MNKVKYNALHMSATEEYDLSRYGFRTYEQAELYILQHICTTCHNDVHNKGRLIRYNNEEQLYQITTPLLTSCGAEWMIQVDWDQHKKIEKALQGACEYLAQILEGEYGHVCPHERLGYQNQDCKVRCQLYNSKIKRHENYMQKIKNCWYWYFYHNIK